MPTTTPDDPTAASRKEDHIELAFRSQVDALALDERFHYEPLLAAHPSPGSLPSVTFGAKQMKAPLWVSSMTGGTEKAYIINQNLARACNEFGLGMGLGSCRPLLSGTERLKDFDIRPLTGQLLRLPLLAIDTAANGGTNFSKLELLRGDDARREAFAPIVNVGHGANEMVGWVNDVLTRERAQAVEQSRKDMDVARTRVQCKHLIISGGLRTFLDGYYLTEKSKLPAVYGQASAFLK